MFKTLKNDIPASIIVFFVALPLCLGIALVSEAPPFAGLIAGIVGGVVVGSLSGSSLGVSGPAAGLAAIVAAAILKLGYENFLVAVVLAGIIQLVFGIIKAGVIGYYFPNSVIKGMLTGIGILIILKEIPHFFGYDKDPEGDWEFIQVDGENTLSEILSAVNHISPGATLVGIIALLILILWSTVLAKKSKIFQLIQGPLVAVVVGILLFNVFQGNNLLAIAPNHLVRVPVPEGIDSFLGQFSFPNFDALGNKEVYIVAFTIALVASLETLLSVEATDKIDPEKRVTPTNRELLAQGTGNIVSGLIGGLPITQVIVRSSANIQSNAKSKMSAILHGFLLLISVILIPKLLNMIPLSALAAVLFVVGYKLAKPSLFVTMWKAGRKQFLPFIVTIVLIVFKDLLWGIGVGLAIGVLIVLVKSYRNSHFLHKKESADHHHFTMRLAEEVTFFNKGAILRELESIPEHSFLELDVRGTKYLDNDIVEILEDFSYKAKARNIHIKLISEKGVVDNPDSYLAFFGVVSASGH
ncbi:SulP family inorganic anion transporter [Neptunitalea lumnitzerae]|uniref:Membrane protein n=1 Tax=Neptunitalea lumnitzerae TaxID=2965509 RepID=A0ABQ5MG00_9FLAO|nr:SulP family inorganic anion transporter [Neptunitalea sp. Y10]GLB48346.1 membrane protein [Neptunitalea sp. Y10]